MTNIPIYKFKVQFELNKLSFHCKRKNEEKMVKFQ